MMPCRRQVSTMQQNRIYSLRAVAIRLQTSYVCDDYMLVRGCSRLLATRSHGRSRQTSLARSTTSLKPHRSASRRACHDVPTCCTRYQRPGLALACPQDTTRWSGGKPETDLVVRTPPSCGIPALALSTHVHSHHSHRFRPGSLCELERDHNDGRPRARF